MKVRKASSSRQGGFTIIELVVTVAIMGIIVVPLGDFMLSYLTNYKTTANRLADSHDIQITAAYVSQDVANTGLHGSAAPFSYQQSAWVNGSMPASYCGQGTGTPVVLLRWDSYTTSTVAGGFTGQNNPASVLYVTNGPVLHRVYCAAGTTTTSNAILIHNLSTTASPAASVTCKDTFAVGVPCTNDGTPGHNQPVTFTFTFTISSGTSDQAAPTNPVTLTGRRRQS